MQRLPVLSGGERHEASRFVIGFGVTIILWACVHDLYLIGVEPRHFTVYHRSLLPLSNHALLALQYATVATLGPGMVFGAIAFAVCRLGRWTPLNFWPAWFLFLPFVALIEVAALCLGHYAAHRFEAGLALPYPETLYPDSTAGIAYTQSVNITAYLGAAVLGGMYQLVLFLVRLRRARIKTAALL